MKNTKMATKLGLGFCALLCIMIALGGVAIAIMRMVAAHSRMMAQSYVPETVLSTALERNAWQTMYNMRAYALCEDPQLLAAGRTAFNDVLASIRELGEIAGTSPDRTTLRDSVRRIKALADEYDHLISETEGEVATIARTRQMLDEAAATYMTNCLLYVADQQSNFLAEIDAGLAPELFKQRVTKLARMNAVIQGGDAIRLGTHKFQALRNPEYLDQALAGFPAVETNLESLLAMTTRDENKVQIARIQEAARSYRTAMEDLRSAWLEREALGIRRNAVGNSVLEAARAGADVGVQHVVDGARNAVQRLSLAQPVLYGGLAVALLVSLLVTSRLGRSITVPLLQGVEHARQMAAGNFTQVMNVTRRDELGILADALNSTSEQLRKQIAEIQGAVGVLATSASEISVSVTQVAAGSTETAAAVSETTATVEEVKQTSRLASETARSVTDAAAHAAEISLAGRKATEETMLRMGDIRQQMGAIADSIVRLSEQSQAIGTIIATVDDIAEQSNLLAVNAAIEAAKAGELGKGFGVVAQEIKSLASQSKQATGQVRTILADIQKATSAAVMVTDQGSKAVEIGVTQARQTGESIDKLANSIQDAAQVARQIATSSHQQVAGMDQVSMAMENIKEASHQNVESMGQLKTAARSLQDLGEKLRALVALYKA